MSELQIALYARVSSSQQAAAGTIASQLTALRERIAADGGTLLPPLEFIDEGYSGRTFLSKLHVGEICGLTSSSTFALARSATKFAIEPLNPPWESGEPCYSAVRMDPYNSTD